MRSQKVELGNAGREARFVPGWWILPGLLVSAATWAGAIWLIVRHWACPDAHLSNRRMWNAAWL